MPKIAFLGAGSTVFAKNILGDCLLTPSLRESEFALFDIDLERLGESEAMLNNINKNTGNYGKIVAYTDRKKALEGADYVINAIQVGGYEPCTVIDFEVPKKYGLRQTIADTLGIGGIFRALRTIPVMEDFARYGRSLPRCVVLKLHQSYGNPHRIHAQIYWCKNHRFMPQRSSLCKMVVETSWHGNR